MKFHISKPAQCSKYSRRLLMRSFGGRGSCHAPSTQTICHNTTEAKINLTEFFIVSPNVLRVAINIFIDTRTRCPLECNSEWINTDFPFSQLNYRVGCRCRAGLSVASCFYVRLRKAKLNFNRWTLHVDLMLRKRPPQPGRSFRQNTSMDFCFGIMICKEISTKLVTRTYIKKINSLNDERSINFMNYSGICHNSQSSFVHGVISDIFCCLNPKRSTQKLRSTAHESYSDIRSTQSYGV